jgi:hypothetical protein
MSLHDLESHKVMEGHSESYRGTPGSLRDMLSDSRVTQSHSESFRVVQDHSESLRVTQSHSWLNRVTQSHYRVTQSHQE